MSKLNPHVFLLPPNAQLKESLWMQAQVRKTKKQKKLFQWQTPGGSSRLHGPSMNLDPAVCVCVCEREEEILSSIFSSTILSPKKPFLKGLYENSSCFQTDLFWEIGCLASLNNPPLPRTTIFSLIVMRILRRQKKYWHISQANLNTRKHQQEFERALVLKIEP